MTAYEAEQWHDLFVMVGGASAALAGLIFVAVSVNADMILTEGRLPSLAARSLSILMGLVVLSIVVLVPGQGSKAVGIEMSVVGVGLAGGVLTSWFQAFDRGVPWSWQAQDLLLSVVSTVPMTVGGVSMISGSGGGLFWAVGQSGCGLAGAV